MLNGSLFGVSFRSMVVGACPLALGLVLLSGCGGRAAADDPTSGPADQRVKDERLTFRQQMAAMDDLWNEGRVVDRAQAREKLKNIAWVTANQIDMRVRAMQLLLEDELDTGNADTRQMFALMLPVEPSFEVIGYICQTAADKGWKEMTPAIVRSWARNIGRPDAERSERAALIKLHPGESVERVVYRVFVTPPSGGGAQERQWAQRARTAAWEVLTRIDPTGSNRLTMLAADSTPGDALVENLRACVRELRAIPLTASQLEWLQELRSFDAVPPAAMQKGQGFKSSDGASRRAWWSQASSAAQSVVPKHQTQLSMRNLEALRFASAGKSPRLLLSRDALFSELSQRVSARKTYIRVGVQDSGQSWADEGLESHRAALTWADLLTVLVIDDAMADAGVRAQLWEQIQRDLKDTTTELGGLIELNAQGRYEAVLYPPRATARRGDDEYVAPVEMFQSGPMSLAHYHFHSQRINNRSYAGPGPGDEMFAVTNGRANIVVTPVGEKRFNIDYYQGAGVVVDLGEFVAP
jgi:hypothetical protein